MRKLIILITFVLTLNQLWAQEINCKNVQSLEFNYSFDKTRSTNSGWSALDIAVKEKSVFFLGEVHNILSNRKMNFSVFSYLYYNASVRYYIMEGNFSIIYLINKYVQTGNLTYLESLKEISSEVTEDGDDLSLQLYNGYFFQLEAFRNFFKSLPEDEKFQIIGIDMEPFFYTNIVVKAMIDESRKIPSEILPAIDSLLNFKSNSPFPYLNSKDRAKTNPMLNFLSSNFNMYKQKYEEYFKEDYILFEMLLKDPDILSRKEVDLLNRFVMMKNYYNIEHGNSFFQYGILHAQLRGKWLAAIINSSDGFKNKVLTIGTQYNNCSSFYKPKYFGAISDTNKKIRKVYDTKIKTCIQSDLSIINVEKTLGVLAKEKLGFSFIVNVTNQ